MNYQAKNKKAVRINLPSSIIDKCSERLQGAKYFPSLNLKSGYHGIKNRELIISKREFIIRSYVLIYLTERGLLTIFSCSLISLCMSVKLFTNRLNEKQKYNYSSIMLIVYTEGPR